MQIADFEESLAKCIHETVELELFRREELEAAAERLKTGEASGLDQTTVEAVKITDTRDAIGHA